MFCYVMLYYSQLRHRVPYVSLDSATAVTSTVCLRKRVTGSSLNALKHGGTWLQNSVL
jgi:hypothetical protein